MSTDVWLEPEFWADFGELDEVERNELYILTNELFTISPKKGNLEPGAHVSIVFTHKSVHYNYYVYKKLWTYYCFQTFSYWKLQATCSIED